MMDSLQPRFVRQKYAPGFFGVTRQTFDRNIRPYLTEIWLGDSAQSGIVYDIHDLNALADIIKERNGRPGKKGEIIWDVKIESEVCTSSKDPAQKSGMFKERSSANELEKALKLNQEKRRKSLKPS
tara:strand:+ start:74 stop:451 length:378 start_codon:yes stop_codon:yes gene_type:complete